MATQRTVTTGPGMIPGADAVPADPYAAQLIAAGFTPEECPDGRTRAQRRTGTRAERARTAAELGQAAAWALAEDMTAEDRAELAAHGLRTGGAPLDGGTDALPPGHPLRELQRRVQAPAGLFDHLDGWPEDCDEHAHAAGAPRPDTQDAERFYTELGRYDTLADRAAAVAVLMAHLARLLTLTTARADSTPYPAAQAEDWPPPWAPPPAHLALTTSTLTAAPPAPAPPVLALRACSPMAA